MKLLYLADIRFPMERANGIQTVETAHALARAGVEVELMVRRSDERSDAECLAFFGLEAHRKLRLSRVATPWGRASFLRAALGRARSGAAGVVFTRDLVIAELVLRFGRAPVVYEAHTVASVFARESADLYAERRPPSSAKLGRLDAREKRVCRGARGVVAITRALEEALTKRHGPMAPTRVVPDGCRVEPEPPPHRLSEPPRIGYIGQLYPWKGVDVLVEAMTRVPRAELVIVGGLPPEPDLERVKRLSTSLGLGERVVFRGFLPPRELPAERARLDLFVIPLLESETARLFTSPLKLFEAMASGCPIVASDLPSIREVLTHERNALLVPPGEPSALASALNRILEEPELGERLAAKAFEDVKDYSWDRRAERLARFLEARG